MLIALPALGVVIVAGMRGHTAPAARVRPALGPTACPDAPDLAGRVLKGVAEAMGGAAAGEVRVRDRGGVCV